VARDALNRDLQRLREELAENRELDPDTRASLAVLAEDIERVLGEEHAREQSLPDQVRAAASQFEAEHPRLARILSELTDTLAKLGI